MTQIVFLQRLVSRFQSDDRGAVTVDWVVMTAAVVSLALGSIHIWRNSSQDTAEAISTTMSDFEIKTSF